MNENQQSYRIFGSELSPYSVKVRSYFRYKGIPHQWIDRRPANLAEFQKYAKLPLVPLVVTPEGEGIQDSTPIIERFEAAYPEPSILPRDETLRFLAALLEEYADEWGNKHMFHYRWWYEDDQLATASRIAASQFPGDEAAQEKMAQTVRERMVPRLSFVGSNETTKPILESSFADLSRLLESHLAERDFVLGAQPSMADFGLFAQLHQASTDPTAGAVLNRERPRTMAWIETMLDPEPTDAGYESWGALEETLAPLLRTEVAGRFLPWSLANARALAAGKDTLEMELDGMPYSQQPQKYHAKSLGALREKYAALAANEELRGILAETGCLEMLR